MNTRIQFSHANGFPAPAYHPFFEQLAPYEVSYVPVTGHGQYDTLRSWHSLSEELIRDIENRGGAPVIGLGHSLGAVLTLWAAQRRPELFSQIILMDPPLFPWEMRLVMRGIHALRLGEKAVPIARQALLRKDHFASEQEAYDYWKGKRFFKDFHPASFDAYVRSALKPSEQGGVELLIPKTAEARIFSFTPYEIGNTRLAMPSSYLYAEKGGILNEKQMVRQRRRFPQTAFIGIAGGHMFPLEQPEETAALIKSLIV